MLPLSSFCNFFCRSNPCAAAFFAALASASARFSSRALMSSAGSTNFTSALPSKERKVYSVGRDQEPRHDLPSWSSRATPKGTRSVSRSLSHNARISFVAPSAFEIASCRTPSLKEDKTLKYGITTSSRCAYWSCLVDGRFDCGGVSTHVHGSGPILGRLAPSKLRWVPLPKPKHPKHAPDPSRYTL